MDKKFKSALIALLASTSASAELSKDSKPIIPEDSEAKIQSLSWDDINKKQWLLVPGNGENGPLVVSHTSHRSHLSHRSHSSHKSHYSHYSGSLV